MGGIIAEPFMFRNRNKQLITSLILATVITRVLAAELFQTGTPGAVEWSAAIAWRYGRSCLAMLTFYKLYLHSLSSLLLFASCASSISERNLARLSRMDD